MNDAEGYLWYIIPGAFFLLPFIIILNDVGILKINHLGGLLLIFVMFIFGFLLHTFYRYYNYRLLYGRTPIHVYLKGYLEAMPKYKKTDFNRNLLDSHYFYYIFSNKNLSSYYKHINRRDFHINSLRTMMVSIFLSLGLSLFWVVYLCPFFSKDFFYWYVPLIVAYFFIICLFFSNLRYLKKDKFDKESFLIKRRLKSEMKRMDEEGGKV